MVMDDATRARLMDYLSPAYPPTRGSQEVVHRDDLTALLDAYDALTAERDALELRCAVDERCWHAERSALEAAQAEAAPVLAAADRWFDAQDAEVETALETAVLAWRAAREG